MRDVQVHLGSVVPSEADELLVIESVTFDNAGWYTATQVSDTKVEPVSASFYLNVVEAVPLHGWAVLVALTCVALVAAGRVGTVGRVGRRVK